MHGALPARIRRRASWERVVEAARAGRGRGGAAAGPLGVRRPHLEPASTSTNLKYYTGLIESTKMHCYGRAAPEEIFSGLVFGITTSHFTCCTVTRARTALAAAQAQGDIQHALRLVATHHIEYAWAIGRERLKLL